MILSGQSIRERKIFTPFFERSGDKGLSYGLGPAGYDVRVRGDIILCSGTPGRFMLASTIEHFAVPDDVLGVVHDKSTWARLGLTVKNTVIEPGWRGYLTLELSNDSDVSIHVREGSPIAQIVFHLLDRPAERPYAGKYQDQKAGVQEAIFDEALNEVAAELGCPQRYLFR